MNPFGAMNLMNQIRTVMNNPASLAEVMLQRNTIDQKTYEQIKGMNPQQIGQYMMNNGLLNQNQAAGLYQRVPGIQRML